ncbi:hypothetical protein WJ69_22945 [Burkholderia ubonensis]|uniref:hypothetical protein n=1 Tax=Burkholderia ubonensis TaxID=101571 RepID=UPI00076D5F84|nr:hypothetical protein [Burkholderia ubonensis]KVO05561.1 hypothetical protein WJ69_22945 [Burkholderia ubonensis]
MGLPRHLRDKYSATDGAPIADAATGTAGTQATSTPATQQQGTTSAAQGTEHTDPNASTATAATGTQPNAPTGEAAAASAQPLTPSGDGGADDAAGTSGDDNFRRMEGRYKAEVTRLKGLLEKAEEGARGASQLTDLLMETRQELANTRHQLVQLQGGAEPGAHGNATAGGQGRTADEPALPELSDEEQAMYGDFAPVAEKLIARATAPLLKQISDLQKANGTSSDAVGQLNENLFVRDVGARVPEMAEITKSPAWKEYLQRNIPLTRLRIQDALMNAHNERDLAGVVSIFDAFKTEQGSQQPPAGTSTSAPAAAGGAAGAAASSSANATGLAQFATPDRTAANGTVRPNATFKESDYRARVDSMRTGKISKAEFMQFDKEFQEARSRGLVSKD